MIKFNPTNKKILSYRECMDPITKIYNQIEATFYLHDYIKYIQKALDNNLIPCSYTATQIAKINIAFYASNLTKATSDRIMRLFLI